MRTTWETRVISKLILSPAPNTIPKPDSNHNRNHSNPIPNTPYFTNPKTDTSEHVDNTAQHI